MPSSAQGPYYKAVIEYAPECLGAVRGVTARRDITLSAALAHCELSHLALTSNPPRVGEGCELLAGPCK